MDKAFIPYKQALDLRELSYKDIFPLGYYTHVLGITFKRNFHEYPLINDSVAFTIAPTYQQAFKWFREKHGLYSAIVPKKSYPDNFVSGIEWYVEICGGNGIEIGPDGTYSYEEAELACLIKLIELINDSN